MLSHHTCIETGILEEKDSCVATKASFEAIKGKVFDDLSRTFLNRTQNFARGTRFRREGRAPYLHLLYWLANSDEWSLSIEQAIRRHPELRGSVLAVVEGGHLENLISSDLEISAVLHFDPNSRVLTVEDPQYVYFLRNLSWSKFASDLGFMSFQFPSRYDFALSFAGSDRDVADALFKELQEMEFEVFYDRNEQHRILAEDIEDYLRPIYQSDAQFVVVLLGPDYPNRIWTKFESDQFKQRFGDGAVIPIWFSNAPLSAFDRSRSVGGIPFNREGNIDGQTKEIAELLRRKMSEIR